MTHAWSYRLFRDGDVAVITPSKEDIALEITVTNRDGDDAHQSHSVIRLPDTLRYSSIEVTGSVSVHQRANTFISRTQRE